ncbi:hypothetical protein ACFV5N_15200 [Streptomyces sp. NPDC059853]|uniref:hypothetical protein n=1 Tax=Streptomyces sp. NPDC059853 TaxID=3346973 RepID=UPI003661DBCB
MNLSALPPDAMVSVALAPGPGGAGLVARPAARTAVSVGVVGRTGFRAGAVFSGPPQAGTPGHGSPAPAPPAGGAPPWLWDVHLRLDAHVRETARWAEYADVLTTSVAVPEETAERHLARMLADHPGCLLAAVPLRGSGGCLMGTPGRLRLTVVPEGEGGRPSHPWPAVASYVHAWLATRQSPRDLHEARLVLPAARATLRMTSG